MAEGEGNGQASQPDGKQSQSDKEQTKRWRAVLAVLSLVLSLVIVFGVLSVYVNRFLDTAWPGSGALNELKGGLVANHVSSAWKADKDKEEEKRSASNCPTVEKEKETEAEMKPESGYTGSVAAWIVVAYIAELLFKFGIFMVLVRVAQRLVLEWWEWY